MLAVAILALLVGLHLVLSRNPKAPEIGESLQAVAERWGYPQIEVDGERQFALLLGRRGLFGMFQMAYYCYYKDAVVVDVQYMER